MVSRTFQIGLSLFAIAESVRRDGRKKDPGAEAPRPPRRLRMVAYLACFHNRLRKMGSLQVSLLRFPDVLRFRHGSPSTYHLLAARDHLGRLVDQTELLEAFALGHDAIVK